MKFFKFLDQHLEEIIMAILICVISFNTCLQVFMRYVLKNALPWPDELSKYCFIYSGFFSIGYCIRRHAMIRVNFIDAIVPKKVLRGINLLVDLFMTVFFSFLFVNSIAVFREFWTSKMVSPALQIPMWVLYACAVVGFALAIARCVQSIVTFDIPSLSKRAEDEKAENR